MKFAAVQRHRRGVSLVELILVIGAMMGVAALAWKAGAGAIRVANNLRVNIEIAGLQEAIENFNLQFGGYPPDFHDQESAREFFKAKFPKCPPENYPDPGAYGPDSALYFWLAGPRGRGFSANPANPFETGGKRRIGPFFKFDVERLRIVGRAVQYLPPRNGNGDPYVYFRGGPKGYDGHPGWKTARPYRDSKTGKWINPQSFQILCAGNDGKFGSGIQYPSGSDYDPNNYDDLANFTSGDTMRQAMPAKPKP
jgi:hypothetical protein